MDVFRLIAEHGDHEVAAIEKQAARFDGLPAHLVRKRDAIAQMTAIAKTIVPAAGAIQPHTTESVVDLIRYVAEHGRLEAETLVAKIEHLGASAQARARAEALEQIIAIAAPLCSRPGVIVGGTPQGVTHSKATLASGLAR